MSDQAPGVVSELSQQEATMTQDLSPQLKLVLFENNQEQKKVWGVEALIYIDEKLREGIKLHTGLIVPQDIDRIKILDLHPEELISSKYSYLEWPRSGTLLNLMYQPGESNLNRFRTRLKQLGDSLPQDTSEDAKDHYRQFLEKANEITDINELIKLVRQTNTFTIFFPLPKNIQKFIASSLMGLDNSEAGEQVINYLFTPFANVEANIVQMNKIMQAEKNTENSERPHLYFVLGHGGNKPWMIGEAENLKLYTEVRQDISGRKVFGRIRKEKDKVELGGSKFEQRFASGNRLFVQDLLNQVEKSQSGARVIALLNCNPNNDSVEPIGIPVALADSAASINNFKAGESRMKFVLPKV